VRLQQWLDQRQPQLVSEELAEEIRQAIGPLTASRLKHLLRESGVPLAPLVEGVRQESPEALERMLRALSELYETGTLDERSRCRGQVIEARQHALWALAKLEGEPRREREDMRATMLVWLENPALFRAWADARRRLKMAPNSDPASALE
jgi:phage terminase large subunit-like protein